MTREWQGVLRGRTIWQGDVSVVGDVVVDAGASLLIHPGTTVRLAPRARWACSIFRNAPEGYPIEASSRDRCDLVVLGRLEIFGTAFAPVVFGPDGAWGGLHCLGDARVEATEARFGGYVEHGMQAFDDSTLMISRCRLQGGRSGVNAWGHSRVSISESAVFGAESGVIVCDAASLRIDGSTFERCGQGCSAEGWSVVRIARTRFVHCRDGAVLARHRAWVKLDASGSGARAPIVRLDEATVDA